MQSGYLPDHNNYFYLTDDLKGEKKTKLLQPMYLSSD